MDLSEIRVFIQPGQSCATCTVTLRMHGVPPVLNVQRDPQAFYWPLAGLLAERTGCL